MNICKFKYKGESFFGDFRPDHVIPCDISPYGDSQDIRSLPENIAISDTEIVSPFNPTKIICVGRNYADHAKELGNEIPSAPLLFLKANSSLSYHNEPIVLPVQSKQVEHEAELAVIIGRKCVRLVDEAEYAKYVAGYSCLNDVTARDVQKNDVQFTRGKSFDTFCPAGPLITTNIDPANLRIRALVNGETKQDARTSQMIFDIPFLVRYISHQMTLYAGDIIATGTPAGVSRLKDGDLCEVEIEGIGSLRNTVTK